MNPCAICRTRPGRCHICNGSLEIGPDTRGQTARAANSFGLRPQRARTRQIPCPVCQRTGKCYRCNGLGKVSAPTISARAGGLVDRLQQALNDWEQFCETHSEQRLLLDASPENREAAAVLLPQLSDRDLEVASTLARRGAPGGWEYEDFEGQVRRRKLVPSNPGVTISRLEELGMIQIAIRHDGNGAFVAAEWPRDAGARLLYQLIRVFD